MSGTSKCRNKLEKNCATDLNFTFTQITHLHTSPINSSHSHQLGKQQQSIFAKECC